MDRWANTRQRYGIVAIALHWGMAALLLVLIALGLYMVRLPDVGFDTEKITLILVHKALGMAAMGVAAVRLAWRVGNALPRMAEGVPQWQEVLARFVHLVFYGLMFALPLTGWLMSSAGGYPVPIFSWFNMPDLVGVNAWLFEVYIAVHRWLAYALIGLLALHAAAALHHHLRVRDDTLRRMLPGG